MRPNDYYGHYKAFVKALSNTPELTLQQYCSENGLVWRRLYDWMRRNRISLKNLYTTYRGKVKNDLKNGSGTPPHFSDTPPRFKEIVPAKEIVSTKESYNIHSAVSHESSTISLSRILLSSGIVIEMKDCSVSALSLLLRQCMGKEVPDVLP